MKAKMKTPSIAGTGGGRKGTSGSTAAAHSTPTGAVKATHAALVVQRGYFTEAGELIVHPEARALLAALESTGADFAVCAGQIHLKKGQAAVTAGPDLAQSITLVVDWLTAIGVQDSVWVVIGDDDFKYRCDAVLACLTTVEGTA